MRLLHLALLIVSAAGAPAAAADASTAAVRADGGGYRLVERPVALFALRSNGEPYYVVHVRLNKRLPPNGLMTLDGQQPEGAPFLASRTSSCYTQHLNGSDITAALAHPKDGARVELAIGRADTEQVRERQRYLTVSVTLRRVSLSQVTNGDKHVKPRLRRMGCKNPSD